jgi:uncharacterized membrane protein YccC
VAIAPVNTWLNTGRPFAQGVALLVKYGEPSDSLLFTLECGENVVSRQKLEAALLAIRERELQEAIAALPVARSHRETPAELDVVDNAQGLTMPLERYPAHLQLVHQDVVAMAKEETHLRSRLPRIATKEERYLVACRIMSLYRQAKAKWARLDHWRDHGKDLAEVTTAEVSGAALQRTLQNLLSYRSRGGTRKPTPERIAQLDAEIAAVKKKLDAL